jgi:hypothetical protein
MNTINQWQDQERRRERATIPVLWKTLIWALSTMVYGGGLILWFLAANDIESRATWLPHRHAALDYSTNALWQAATDEARKEAAEIERDSAIEVNDAKTQTQAAVTAAESPAVAPAPPAALPVTPPAAPAAQESVAAPSEAWPHVRVIGLKTLSNGARAAILDSDAVAVGESHAGLKLIDVDARRVKLEYRGEVRIFYYGSVTR